MRPGTLTKRNPQSVWQQLSTLQSRETIS